jgi:hypothetical protein
MRHNPVWSQRSLGHTQLELALVDAQVAIMSKRRVRKGLAMARPVLSSLSWRNQSHATIDFVF